MALRIDERFVVRAPVEPVWEFLVDPRRVVTCVPGGELREVIDERTYRGQVSVGVGPLTLAYRGQVRLADVDLPARRVRIVGQAHETAGTDTARLTLESWLAPLPGGATEVVAQARVDVKGGIVELGRGVLEPLGHAVFQEFAAAVRARIEAEEARRVALAGHAIPPQLPGTPPPLRAIPLVLRAVRTWLAGKLGRAPAAGAPVTSTSPRRAAGSRER